ncbi:hypothetical protein PVK06_031730 [Gossypium arboreum]|uniref:Uncharacterized protein n=1 Tax=Gossypium arboreum TaxID=29729 RepID=A0ABR0NUG2_GOSAR|nr:hypothetical protein PVK06_031730 [Gossypium arboreum]
MVRWHPTMDILFSCSYDNTAKVWWSEDADGGWDCVQTLGIICAFSQVFMIEQSFQFTGQDEWTTFISIAIEEGEGPRQWCPGEKRLLASARTRCESWQLCPDQDSLIFFFLPLGF